ncbi:MAG TPA: sigma-70 family RNA polymerase sigma factor [Solirubrobacterales bacterium]|nr:sigma-70 family RNA polymerase sigma factor [Solirubrobacterales bacterium]
MSLHTSGTEGPTAKPPLDDASMRWMEGLRDEGARRERTVGELREVLLKVARRQVHNRRAQLGYATGPEVDDIAQQAADDALIAICGALDSFRGESRFTTWAYKFVVFQVSAKVSHHAWQTEPPSREEFEWGGLSDRAGGSPAEQTERRELLSVMTKAVKDDLTERQRAVFVAVALNEVPIDVVAIQLGSNRNAIYKNLFDARRALRNSLAAAGLSIDPDEVEI